MSSFRTYRFAALSTLTIWAAVFALGGGAQLLTVASTAGLALAFSVDNATVNARELQRLPGWARRVFLVAGVPVAVFGAQSVLPIGIIALTSHTAPLTVLADAMHDPGRYAAMSAAALPTVHAFGAVFLAMVAAGFVPRVGRVAPVVLLLAALAMFTTVGGAGGQRVPLLVAAVLGVAVHMGLDMFGADEGEGHGRGRLPMLAGAAAVVGLIRLEAINASFTLDSVVGALAITASLPLLMAGLTSGEVWVRALTMHMLRANALERLPYLGAGAHAAIAALAVQMAASLYGVDVPGWATGAGGLAIIGASIVLGFVTRPGSVVTVPA